MEPIPEDIQRFMDGNLESLEQLEILRVLSENQSTEWTVPALARQVQSQAHHTAQHLAALQSRGLLTTVTTATEVCCRYGVATPDLENHLNRLLQLYKERPVTIIRMIYARKNQTLQAFADSFRMRKEG